MHTLPTGMCGRLSLSSVALRVHGSTTGRARGRINHHIHVFGGGLLTDAPQRRWPAAKPHAFLPACSLMREHHPNQKLTPGLRPFPQAARSGPVPPQAAAAIIPSRTGSMGSDTSACTMTPSEANSPSATRVAQTAAAITIPQNPRGRSPPSSRPSSMGSSTIEYSLPIGIGSGRSVVSAPSGIGSGCSVVSASMGSQTSVVSLNRVD